MWARGGFNVWFKHDGNAEYISEGQNAYCYSPGKVEDGIRIIESVVARRDDNNQIALAGRQTAETRAWDAVFDEVVKLYE